MTRPPTSSRRPPRLPGLALRLLGLAFAVACIASPDAWRPGFDFSWRRNEALCVLAGLDPWEVCFGGVPSERFCSVFDPVPGKLPVNGYAPWEYAWMLPFAAIPPRMAHTLFALLNAAALAGVAALARRHALRRGLSSPDAWTVTAGAIFLGLSLYRVLQVSNFGLLMAFAAFALCECLERRRNVLAGLCWAAVLVKPQIGLPLAIPLLLGHHAVALATGIAFCALSTLPVAALCHANPFRMTLRVLHSGTHSIRSGEPGTALLPPEAVSALARIAPPSLWLVLCGVLALVLCLALSWRFRRHPDTVARLAPALAVGLAWMPAHFHDRVLLAPVLAWLLTETLAKRSRRAFAAWLVFGAEFWAVPLVGLAFVAAAALFAKGLSGGFLGPVTRLIDVPGFRITYDLALCAVAWLQLAALQALGRDIPPPEGART